MTSVAEKIKYHRRRLGLTQAQLADLLDVKQGVVARWERKMGQPKNSLIPPLAKVLGLSPNDLIEEDQINLFAPSMAYWGSVFDNAKKAVDGDTDLEVIRDILKRALSLIDDAIAEKQ